MNDLPIWKTARRLAAVAIILSSLYPGVAAIAGDRLLPQATALQSVPNRLIVKVKSNAVAPVPGDMADLQARLSAFGGPKIRPLFTATNRAATGLSAAGMPSHPAAAVFILDFGAPVDLEARIMQFEALPWVEYAERDLLMSLFAEPDDPLLPWQWGLENTGQTIPIVDRLPGYNNDTIAWVNGIPGADINFRAMYEYAGPRSPVIVGILDTGSDIDHEDLTDHLWRNPGEIPDNGLDDDHNGYIDDYFGYDFSGDEVLLPNELTPDSDPADTIGHGTHVAGIVAAVTDNGAGIAGIAGSARIMTLKVFPNAFYSIIAEAIYYGADNGVDILNMSFGGPYPSKTVSDALAYARSRGVLPIAASGNTGSETDNYPSADTSAFSVGAVDYLGRIAEFSSYGEYLDLVAPGASILSLRAAGTDLYGDGGEPDVHIVAERYYLADGTSMAAPYAAGCAAALLAIEGGLTPERQIEILHNSCVDMIDPFGTGESFPGRDKYSGYGLVNLGRAINELAGISLKIESPGENSVQSGTVTITGTAAGPAFTAYQLEYGAGARPTVWTSLVSSTKAVENGTLYIWSTALLTGPYTIRLRAASGHEDRVTITLANTAVTELLSPLDGDTISLIQTIRGSTVAPDYRQSIVSFAPQSNPQDTTIAWSGTVPVVNDSICSWTLDATADGWHFLKLITVTESGTEADSVLVYIKNPFHPGWPAAIPAYAFYTPAAANLDRDPNLEFIIPTAAGLYVFREDGSIAPGWPRDTDIGFQSIPAVADLDRDGLYEIIIASEDYIHIYTFFGIPYSGWPRAFSGRKNLYGVAIPLVCDLDNMYGADGIPEILAIDYGGVIRAYHDDGSDYVFSKAGGPLIVDAFSTGAASVPRPVVVDLDRDGRNELIVAADGVWVWDAATGASYRNLPPQIRDFKATYGLAVGNFNDDDELEIAVAYTPVGSGIFHLDILKVSGASLPGWPVATAYSDERYLLNSLSAGDVDGDGRPEVFIAPYFIGDGAILAYRANGAPLLPENQDGRFIHLSGSSSPVSLVDITGDNQPEIVAKVGEFFYGDEYLYALTPDGAFAPGFPLRFGYGIGTQLAAPLPADLDSDGRLNLLTIESSGLIATAWDFNVPFKGAAQPWPKFRRDNWNSGILPSFPASHQGYHILYIVKFINYLFRRGAPFPPYDPSDLDCDGRVTIMDLIVLINYVYRLGAEPCIP